MIRAEPIRPARPRTSTTTARRRQIRGVRLVLAILALLTPLTGFSRGDQPAHLTRVWESENGLPGNVVRSMAQTADGYLWLATAEGIARFDGLEFQLIEPEGGLRRSQASFYRLFVTGGSQIWAATFQGGLYRVYNNSFVSVIEDSPRPRSPRITQLLDGPDGAIVFKRGTEVFTLSEGKPLMLPTPGGEVLELLEAHQARSRRGGRSSDGSGVELIDRHGLKWSAAPADRLVVIDPAGNAKDIVVQSGEPVHSVNELLEDREGTIWAATALSGLVQIRRAKVTVLDADDGLHDPAVFALLEGKDGVWWLANRSGGIDRWTPESIAHLPFGGRGYRPVSALFEDREGYLWAAARDGSVFRLEEGEFVPQFGKTQVPSKVRAMAQDPSGTLWFGGNQGIVSYDGNKVRFHELDGEQVFDVSVIVVGTDGKLLAATTTGRVFEGDTGGFREITGHNSLGQRWVSGILAVSPIEIWATTLGGGIYLWDGENWHPIGPDSGLPDSRLTSILRDDSGHLWFGSLGGIIRASRYELLVHLKNRATPVRWLRLDRYDGMPSRECIGGAQPAGWKGRDGQLWFPTSNGVVRVRPDALELNRVPPPVFLTSVRTNGGAVAAADSVVTAGPGRARLEFRFVGLSLAAPEKVSYQARLAGLDDPWWDVGNQRHAAFEAVPPGHYTFEVIAINGDGQTSSTAATIAVRVLPNFWETRWFLTAAGATVVLAAAGSGWLVARARMKRRIQALKIRHARENERSRIARDLHDELGASLTEISILAALAAEDAGESAFYPSLHQLSHKATNVVGALDEIVWAVNPREDTLRSLVDYIAAFAREFLDLAGISLRIDVPREIPELPLAAGQRHGVFLAARETLNNIVKHAEAREVRLSMILIDHTLEIHIGDDGRGFDPDRDCAGHGLQNLQQRMHEAGGHCHIVSRPTGGTSVTLQLPLSPP